VILSAYDHIAPPHVDEKLLAEFRVKFHCEWCRQPAWERLQPNHIVSRGMGGWRRLDIGINLIAMHAPCHCLWHAGHIKLLDLLGIVAEREGCRVEDIQETMAAILRRSKKWIVA
jgi:hypothetical protein